MEEKDRTVFLKQYNYDTKEYDSKGEVDISLLTKSMTEENVAEFFAHYCNRYSAEYRDGQVIGKLLQGEHRTLQATVVRFCLGIITGIADVDMKFTDPRNETAVKCGNDIAVMIENGSLKMGYMI